MVFDVAGALARRWYVVVIGLLLTAGMVYGAYKLSPPEYTARALVLLLPSKAEVGQNGNPFLHLDGLEPPAGILSAYFSSAPARAEVEKLSPDAEYEVGIDDSTRGPVIAVDVTTASPAETQKVLDYLLMRIPAEFTRLQQEVDARGSAAVGSMPLTVDRQPKADIRGTVRAMVAALVMGIVATGVTGFAIDGFAQRRNGGDLRRRRLTVARPAAAPVPTWDLDPPTDTGVDQAVGVASSVPKPVRPTWPTEPPPPTATKPSNGKTLGKDDQEGQDRALATVPAPWSWGGREN